MRAGADKKYLRIPLDSYPTEGVKSASSSIYPTEGAKMNSELRREYRTQLEAGGYSIPPGRAACALVRARDRLLLDELETLDVAKVQWVYDESPDLSWADDATLDKIDRDVWSVRGCIVSMATGEEASLWGIVGPYGDPYERVVEAELAGDVFGQVELGR